MSVKEAFEYITTFSVKHNEDGTLTLYVDDLDKYDEACDIVAYALGLDMEED